VAKYPKARSFIKVHNKNKKQYNKKKKSNKRTHRTKLNKITMFNLLMTPNKELNDPDV